MYFLVDSSEFLDRVLDADKKDDDDLVEALLCGAVKHLVHNKLKPDQGIYLGLMVLARSHRSYFQMDNVLNVSVWLSLHHLFCICIRNTGVMFLLLKAFVSLLRRDVIVNVKSKGSPVSCVLVANVLMKAFKHHNTWPDVFVKVSNR